MGWDVIAEWLVESALNQTTLIEDMGYDNLVIRIKASDVMLRVRAYKLIVFRTRSSPSFGE
ncbi:MAG: hypothetical protein HUJ74_04185 [Lachnospiraceae bacterium]|nr:hypothetical protein [Lachnospiraceae bacterium]